MSVVTPERVAELERLISNPIDPEYELWRANRHRFVRDPRTGMVVPVRHVSGGSGTTGQWAEVLYVNSTAGTAKNTFTTEATINDTAGMGPFPMLNPAVVFTPSARNAVGVTVKVTARGIYSTTGAPTWQTFCRFNAGTPAAPPTGPNVGSTAATAGGSGVTNALWEHEEDITLTVLGAAGANSTLRGLGVLTLTPSISTGIFGGGASPGTVATFDFSATTYVTFSAACGTSSASNSIQVLQLIIMGLN